MRAVDQKPEYHLEWPNRQLLYSMVLASCSKVTYYSCMIGGTFDHRFNPRVGCPGGGSLTGGPPTLGYDTEISRSTVLF